MTSAKPRVAVVGAGIYGSTIALRLSQDGCDVTLFDRLGIMHAASAINQFRVHAGYHYPRSPETIAEIQECRGDFLRMFAQAIVGDRHSYYAIPKEGTKTSVGEYQRTMAAFGLPLIPVAPGWIDFDFIDRCWQVDEQLYDPTFLARLVEQWLVAARIPFIRRHFDVGETTSWDFVVWATYGLYSGRSPFRNAKIQVVEKVKIRLPPSLQRIGLVVVDGPFTAFDPYGGDDDSQFGSARLTSHWTGHEASDSVPAAFTPWINRSAFEPCPFTRFAEMRSDCEKSVPLGAEAVYLGSRFTLRVVEDREGDDRRILKVAQSDERTIHVFSGKVVGAVKAAALVSAAIGRG